MPHSSWIISISKAFQELASKLKKFFRKTYPNSGLYHVRTDVWQEKNQQILVVVGRLSQHVERLDRDVRIVVSDDKTAVFVVDWSALLELVCCTE